MEGLWIHLYSSNDVKVEIAGGTLELAQVTDYPWDGEVKLAFIQAPAAAFSLSLRIPRWVHQARVYINCIPVTATPGPIVRSTA
jgi:DUF1680 family protein